MKFTKMQGCGNDYLFLDCTRMVPPDLPQLAMQLSDRHFGPGGDGLICEFPSKIADVRMVMFNADGSEGAMCSNRSAAAENTSGTTRQDRAEAVHVGGDQDGPSHRVAHRTGRFVDLSVGKELGCAM